MGYGGARAPGLGLPGGCRGGVAEEGARRLHRPVLGAEHRRPVGRYPGVVFACLVPVSELLGDSGQVGGDPQHQRVVAGRTPGRGLQRDLEDAAGGGGIVGFAVQPGEEVRGGEHLGVIFAVAAPGRGEDVVEVLAGAGRVTGVALGERSLLCGG